MERISSDILGSGELLFDGADPASLTERAREYLRSVCHLGKKLIIVALGLAILTLFIAWLAPSTSQRVGAGCSIALMLMSLYWFLKAIPLLYVAKVGARVLPQLASDLRSVLVLGVEIVIWGLILTKFCIITPIWNNPAAALLIAACLTISLIRKFISSSDYNDFWANALQRVQLGFIYVVSLLSLMAPKSVDRLNTWISKQDPVVAAYILAPKRIEISDPTNFKWFNSADEGTPLVWYALMADGSYHFYDGEGNDEQTQAKLAPVTPGIVAQLLKLEQATIQVNKAKAEEAAA